MSINTRQQSGREWAAQRIVPILRNDRSGLCANAEYNRDDYVFLRAQTREMQMMEWENRMPPLKSWGGNMVANLAWQIFA